MNDHSCTTSEAADALGICVRTVQLWVEQGRLRAWKTPGGHRRILRSSVDEQLRARDEACGAPAGSFGILVVEDDEVLRQMLVSKLKGISPKVELRVACDGVEGLIKFGERPPQVLITDLVMPGLDGFHMLNTLVSSTQNRALQIIAVTGLEDEEIVRNGGVPEGVVVFHKPIQVSLLVSLVRAYYDGWHVRRVAPG